jgi:lipoteichoic acid synthase
MPPQARRHLQSLVDARSWLALVATPSSFLLAVSLIGTLAAKLTQLTGIEGAHLDLFTRLSVCAPDAALLGGLGALLSAGEKLATDRALVLLRWAIRTLALGVFVFASFNVAYMSVTGDQLTASIIAMGWQRLHDAYGILIEELRRHQLQLGAAAALLIVLPWAAQHALRRFRDQSHAPRPAWLFLAACACASLVWTLSPAPSSLPVARLTRSALVASYLTWMEGSMSAPPGPDVTAALRPEPLVENEGQSPTSRYNVIVIAIESLRHDFTSLNSAPRVQTPNIAALAQRGAFSDSASTPLPHTTKALFAAHCGRMPFWQSTLHEFSDVLQVQCLPQLLSNQGYATALLQSAVGAFEERPRLANRLGFKHFEAWENIGAEPLGYLASDDLSLAPALDRFLDSLPSDKPFLATLLTSATHHPYRLPQAEIERLQAQGIAADTLKAEERYGKLVARADQLVGKVLESIQRRGLSERTLIVVFGDHGEGFGEKGVRQHDNNYYQESLRVPLVIAGPGVKPQRMADDVSLLDVAPTLLDLLGFDIIKRNDPLYGRNALSHFTQPRTEYFSCFYDDVCYGLVRGDRKIVYLPELKRALRFDLSVDPGENRVLAVSDDAPELTELAQLAPRLQMKMQPYVSDLKFDNGWFCSHAVNCRHPKTPPEVFFTPAHPDECVKVKPNTVSKQAGYDYSVSLHNVCSGPMVCQVSFATDSHGSETVKLKPNESRELELAHQTPSPDLKYKVDCQFL